MIRHIFIGTFKAGISKETKQKQLVDMQAMKEKIPGMPPRKWDSARGGLVRKIKL